MNYPTNLLRTFAVVCSWRILRIKIIIYEKLAKLILLYLTLLFFHHCQIVEYLSKVQTVTNGCIEKANNLVTCYLL